MAGAEDFTDEQLSLPWRIEFGSKRKFYSLKRARGLSMGKPGRKSALEKVGRSPKALRRAAKEGIIHGSTAYKYLLLGGTARKSADESQWLAQKLRTLYEPRCQDMCLLAVRFFCVYHVLRDLSRCGYRPDDAIIVLDYRFFGREHVRVYDCGAEQSRCAEPVIAAIRFCSWKRLPSDHASLSQYSITSGSMAYQIDAARCEVVSLDRGSDDCAAARIVCVCVQSPRCSRSA